MLKYIKRFIKKHQLEEFCKFVLVGVLATGINYLIYNIFINYIDENIAFTIAYLVSLVFNLLLSHLFTFKQKIVPISTLKFLLAHLINYLNQLILLNIFIFIGIAKNYAPLPVYIIAIPLNFLVVRYALKG
jgi:putative flippase GtrA